MRVGAAVVARLSSRRLPGKVLNESAGRPLIGWVLARLERAPGLDAIALATSDEPDDEPLRAWGREAGLRVCTGPLEDVLGRLVIAAEQLELDAIARVNGDSPWIDPELIGEAVARIREGGHDLVSNVVERRWPYGVAAEVATLGALRRLHAVTDAEERSHGTSGFYARSEDFSILGLRPARDLGSDLRLTVDTEQDLVRFERMLQDLGTGAERASLEQVTCSARRVESISEGEYRS